MLVGMVFKARTMHSWSDVSYTLSFLWIYKLTMFCGSFPILYGKPWALVQTFQTQRAFLFCPDRVAVLALYGLFRTLSSAFIATNTLVLHHLEMLCLALVSVGEVIPVSQPMGETQIIEVADLAVHSHFRYLGNALFCLFCYSQAFLVIRHVKYRSPDIHHSYNIFCIKPQSFVLQ